MNLKHFIHTIPLLVAAATASAADFTKTEHGLITYAGNGTDVEIQFFTPSIVRVIKTPHGESLKSHSLSVTATPQSAPLKINTSGRNVTAKSSALGVNIDTSTGQVSFRRADGTSLTRENAPALFRDTTYSDIPARYVSQSFRLDPKEFAYGLGSLLDPSLSRRNFSMRLMPGNLEDGFPVMQSSKGYGIVWDNYSPTTYSDNDKGMSFTSEIGEGVDYYFIDGGNADGVVAGMRELSGAVPMMPLWTYGYWQSRERYKTQYDPVAVVSQYRKTGVPLDGIIQDWQYWGNNYLWNAMEFMNRDFPRPQAMVDSIHDMNAHAIISIWSSFGPRTKPYAELKEKGLLFDIETWPQSGIDEVWPPRMDYPSGVCVYNPYSPEARDIYWKHLTRLHNYGMDGWWMDSTEPDHFDGRMDFPVGAGTFRQMRGAFPLLTVGGVADHQLAADSTKRVFILTRSGWFGQQRYGCNIWTGDVSSTWDNLRRQIPSHLNMTMSANPNVNSDLGGFFCGRYNSGDGTKAYDNPLFRELTVRWTQLGVFTPMMRSHGTDAPREIWWFGKEGEPVYDALASAIRLRYSLLPYIYSTARIVTAHNGSFMRPLVMDFPNDPAGLDANDRFMFGSNLFVAPIVKAHYTPETETHIDENSGWAAENHTGDNIDHKSIDFTQTYDVEVLLPKGTDWYDFFSGKKYQGGKKAVLTADISTIPLFARAGSIIPIGPDVQYVGEKPWDNLTIRVYPGADGSFTLYEDEGDGYNYTKGAYTEIPFSYNQSKRTLTIGCRQGSYPGMMAKRAFNIVNAATGESHSISYDGSPVIVSLK